MNGVPTLGAASIVVKIGADMLRLPIVLLRLFAVVALPKYPRSGAVD